MVDLRLTHAEAEQCRLTDLLRERPTSPAQILRLLDLVLRRAPETATESRGQVTQPVHVLGVLRTYFALVEPEADAGRDEVFRAELFDALRQVGASILHNALLQDMPPSPVRPMTITADAAALLARPEFGDDHKRLRRSDVGAEQLEGCVLAYVQAHRHDLFR